MPYNFNQICYQYWDDYFMLLVDGDDRSYMDSMERTIKGLITWGRIPEADTAVLNCLNWDGGKYWNLFRHPGHPEKTSRDHWSYFIMYERMILSDSNFGIFMTAVRSMRGMGLWMKVIQGKKWAEIPYYFLEIPGAVLAWLWNGLLDRLGNAGPELDNSWWIRKPAQEDYSNGGWLLKNLTWREKFFGAGVKIKIRGKEKRMCLRIPQYALQVKAWQLLVVPSCRGKRLLKKILIKRVGESNLVLRVLLGDMTVSWNEIMAYPFMANDRPGVKLNRSCGRHIYGLRNSEVAYNFFEWELLSLLYMRLIMGLNIREDLIMYP